MIVVNAANGNQGRLLIPRLIGRGLRVRACVRTEQSAAELRASGVAEVVVGDIADPEHIARAVRGTDKVYHVCPGMHPLERQIGMAWIDAAKRAGVAHFVFSSVLHPILTGLVQHEIKRDIEEHLISSNLEFTILQPAIYMSARRIQAAISSGVLKAPWLLDRKQSLVDIGDLTDVVSTVLTDSPEYAGATYELAGPGRYSAHDVAGVLASALDRPVGVQQISAAEYLAFLIGPREPGTYGHEAAVVNSLQACYSSSDFVGNDKVLGWLLGRPPTTLVQFIAAQVEKAGTT